MSPTVSEIFYRENSPERDISLFFFPIIILFFLLSDEQLVHVSPPTGMVPSWKFRHRFKARDRTKRIFDLGGKIPTR